MNNVYVPMKTTLALPESAKGLVVNLHDNVADRDSGSK